MPIVFKLKINILARKKSKIMIFKKLLKLNPFLFLKYYITFILFLISFSYLNAGIIVLNGLTHENEALPGETYRGSIQIQNTGNEKPGTKKKK